MFDDLLSVGLRLEVQRNAKALIPTSYIYEKKNYARDFE